MRNILNWMGNVNDKMKKKHRKAVNHENIDVNRSKTLEALENQKRINREYSDEGKNQTKRILSHKDTNIYTSDILTPPYPNPVLCHNFHSAPQLQTTQSPGKIKFRKCLKNGRVIEEPISCDSDEMCKTVCDTTVVSDQHRVTIKPQINNTSSTQEVENSFCISDDKDMCYASNCDTSNSPETQKDDDEETLTTDDVQRRYELGDRYTGTQYHAYVNYPDEYISQAKAIVEELERPPHNFRLFLPERQLLCGCYDLEAKSRVVKERCSGKVVSILGKSYMKSEACQFINYFAKTLDPVSKEAKLIPVLVDEVTDIPRIMQGMYLIRYSADSERGFFWKKLAKSIRNGVDFSRVEYESCPSNLNQVT